MAKIRINKSISNNVYFVHIENDPTALSEGDKEKIHKFGEPEINLGGTFLEGTENEFTLPDKFVRICSEFPQTIRFDSRDERFQANITEKIDAYIAAILTAFREAFASLRSREDTFSSELVENI